MQCVVKVPRAEYVNFAWNAIGNTCLVWAFLGAEASCACQALALCACPSRQCLLAGNATRRVRSLPECCSCADTRHMCGREAFCHWNKNDTRVLGNFYLSSFLVSTRR